MSHSLKIILALLLLCQLSLGNSPGDEDWLLTTAGLGVVAGLELYAKDHLVSSTPKWDQPPSFDKTLRTKLWWGQDKQDLAALGSDGLLYGISMGSLIWSPLAAKDPTEVFYVNLRVFTVNSFLTNIAKIYTARSRPYAHYGTRAPQGPRDNTSFFSGHSSVAFSQAVANSMLLSHDYPEHRDLIWSGFMVSAGVTAYLRVAGDMHYVSDILLGSLAGSLIAWVITDAYLSDKTEPTDGETLGKIRSQTGNLSLMIKIPLG